MPERLRLFFLNALLDFSLFHHLHTPVEAVLTGHAAVRTPVSESQNTQLEKTSPV
jgi:hypothetical protein